MGFKTINSFYSDWTKNLTSKFHITTDDHMRNNDDVVFIDQILGDVTGAVSDDCDQWPLLRF